MDCLGVEVRAFPGLKIETWGTRPLVSSCYGQGSAANGLSRGDQLDFDVVAQAVQTLHQLLFREVGEIAAHEAGDLGLWDAHAAASFLLSEAKTVHGARDFDDQAGFDFELFGVRQAKVREHVAGTGFDFDAVKSAVCHLVSPLRVSRLS